MKDTDEYQCGYADGYDAGYWEGRLAALDQLRDHASEILDVYNTLKEEYDSAEKEKRKADLKKRVNLEEL
jgi:flagellar biosynthesis/type III secretory pathway protein FliH